MRRALVLIVLAVVAIRYVPGWLAAASAPPASTNRPPGALDYIELSGDQSIAIFDNRLEARGPHVGDVGFQRIYFEDIRETTAHDHGLDIVTRGAPLAIHLEPYVAALALKGTIDRARVARR